ncbi:MAG: PKD domain-containing protein [Mycobacterium sp.]|nr:PKD domain-containing protein [Mycobacterium sp.]
MLDHRHRCEDLRRGGRRDAQKYRRFCSTQQQQNLGEIIREQYKRLRLPAGKITYQPGWGALVNKAEIFYTTTPATHTYVLTLLGHDVRLTTHIRSYRWTFGDDGQPVISTKPGQPYPDTTITHIYRQPGTCDVRLTVTYTATYTVDGGPPQTIPGTATVPSQPRPLTVHTAHTVLVQGNH